MYTPLAIANAFISRRPGITSVKANKLIWQFHGWTLALGYDLCSEQPACWEYGPVYASAYDAQARKLVGMFSDNFAQYADKIDDDVRAAAIG